MFNSETLHCDADFDLLPPAVYKIVFNADGTLAKPAHRLQTETRNGCPRDRQYAVAGGGERGILES